MAFVRVEQRNALLAGAVRLLIVEGRNGPVSKATLTAISNTRRGGREEGDNRGGEATAIQWRLWGKQVENASPTVFGCAWCPHRHRGAESRE